MVEVTVGNTWSQLKFPPDQRDNVGSVLCRHLTVEVPGAKYLWEYKSGQWDGRVRMFDQTQAADGFVFLTGLLPMVLRDFRYPITKIIDRRGITSPQLLQYSAPLRPYQHEVLSAAFGSVWQPLGWFPRGVLQVATGGGKTEIAVAMYQSLQIPTMFLVHTKHLLLQAQERFAKYGITAGVIGAGKFDLNPRLNIATTQTLLSIMKRNDKRTNATKAMIANTKQVFFDEAHIMASSRDKGNEFIKVASWFDGAYARWGLTATPFMRDTYDNFLLQGISGDVLAAVSTDWLINAGYLTPPAVSMIRVPGKLPTKSTYRQSNKAKAAYWKDTFSKGIEFNSWRNGRIADEILAGPYPMIVLVKTIEQGKFIINAFNAKNPPFDLKLLTGASSAEERKETVKDLCSGKKRAIVVTSIFDEGVDIPELRKLILASGGKSQVKLLQRIGRGLRLAANKHVVEVVDFNDAHHPMLEKHSSERMRVWLNEGFKVKEVR